MFHSDSKFCGTSGETDPISEAVGVIGLAETSKSRRFATYVERVRAVGAVGAKSSAQVR